MPISHKGLAKLRAQKMTTCASATVLAALTTVLPLSALAQDTSSEGAIQIEEIVVQGVRRTIQTSIEEKRNSTTIVDAVTADEIGDLPALSIGEVIETITGASTHREKGGASEISIRGLGPFLGGSTFNGREASNGSGDRAVNFNQFPSELINEVKIYKTQQADLVEGAVSGLIEMETLKPLDYGSRRIQLEGKANYNPYEERLENGNGVGFRGTASYVDQFEFEDFGEVGISLGYQSNDVTNPEEVYSGSTTWNACDDTQDVIGANCSNISREDGADGAPYYFAPNSRTFRQISEDDSRDSLFAAVQWRPNDDWEVNLDFQKSERTYLERRSDLNLSEARRSVTNRVVGDDGDLLYYEGESYIESTSTFRNRTEEYQGGGINVEWQVHDKLLLSTDFSTSETYRNETDRQTRLRSDSLDIYGNSVDSVVDGGRIAYTYDAQNGIIPAFDFGDFDVTDHSLFSDDARLRRDEAVRENQIDALRFDAEYEFDDGFITQLKVGTRFANLTYSDYDDRNEFTNSDREIDEAANLACRTVFPQDDFLSGFDSNTVSTWATFDPICLYEQYLGTEDPGTSDDVRSVADAIVEEDSRAMYFMATYDSSIAGIPVYGNFGVRFVRTDVEVEALRNELTLITNGDGTVTLQEDESVYESEFINTTSSEVLPSLNMVWELDEDVLMRTSVFRGISRPAPSSLGGGRSFSLEEDAETLEVALGNVTAEGSPYLEAIPSWNYDIGLDWYANADTLLAASLYYKQFQGSYIPQLLEETFVVDGEEATVFVEHTVNSDEESTIWGVELTATHAFSYLPGPLAGLGGKLSYNYADSDYETHDISYGDLINLDGSVTEGFVDPANIFGFSEHVFSGQLYYEIGEFDFQTVYKYRSQYYQDFVGGNRQLRYVEDNEVVDFRVSYSVNSNIQLKFEASNIFDEPKVTYMPVDSQVREVNDYGRKYWFGVRYKF